MMTENPERVKKNEGTSQGKSAETTSTVKKERPEKTESGKRLTSMLTNQYTMLHQKAAQGAFVIWVSIVVPVEIFYGFENVVFAVPESHAAMTAGKGVAPLQCEKAENMGYSPDICSYARIDLGTAFDGGKDSPTMGLPQPNLLVSNNNNCSLMVKWFDVYKREWGVPHFNLDIPFCYSPQTEESRKYIQGQFQQLIRTIEDLSGEKYQPEKAAEAVYNSSQTYACWKQFLDFAKHKPAGITAFDTFVQMAPILTSRGSKEVVEHYNFLLEETGERLARGEYPVPNERYRLLWDNIAPWHQLRKMSTRLAELDANIVTASYTYCVGSLEGDIGLYSYDGSEHPLEYLARLQNFSVCPQGLNLRFQSMRKAINEFNIDGVVFASNRSCKVYSLMQIDLQKKVTRELGVPSVFIDVDHADPRKYSEETTFTRLEALLEKL